MKNSKKDRIEKRELAKKFFFAGRIVRDIGRQINRNQLDNFEANRSINHAVRAQAWAEREDKFALFLWQNYHSTKIGNWLNRRII